MDIDSRTLHTRVSTCMVFYSFNKYIYFFFRNDRKLKGKVFVGMININQKNGRNYYEFEQSIIQPCYYEINLSPDLSFSVNDVALLKLNKKIQFTQLIQPIKLGYLTQKHGFHAIVSGWGDVSSDGAKDPRLKYTIYTEVKTSCPIYNSICPIANDGITCMGDSGSPLVANGIQIGIVSSGNCSESDPYSAFTNVQNYLPWIQKVTKIAILQ